MKTLRNVITFMMTGILLLTGCGSTDKAQEGSSGMEEFMNKKIVVGFSQLGAESDWRSANTESIQKSISAENGYELIFENGQQKQANQIMAIRTFIQQEVDYIVLAPVTETGWDTVLQEAKDAGIPVIIVDRMVDVSDESLFKCWVGSDFELEAQKMTEWMHQFFLQNGIAEEEIRLVNIQGTIGASAQIGRTKGLEKAAEKYGWNLIAEASGEFTQAKGKEVMESFLKEQEEINVVYCENDNSAFGAIEAIENAGRVAGSDIQNGEIMVVSFDGVDEDAFTCLQEDKISCIAECNPYHGPRVRALIEQLEKGEAPDKFSYVSEKIYSTNENIKSVTVEDEVYFINILSDFEKEKTDVLITAEGGAQ